jgi:CheY-like chemotaxis protein
MKPPLVLVVEDNPATAELERVVLTRAGYNVQTATSASGGLEFLEQQRPDLVLLDLVMPEADGWCVLEGVSWMPDPPPVVVLSGVAKTPVARNLRPWLSGYVVKPFQVDRLLRGCSHALNNPGLRPPTGTRSEKRRTFVANASVMLPTGTREEAQVYDLSRGGFCFDLKEALPVGEIMRVAIQLPWMRSDLLLSGTVRWSRGALHGAQIVASPVSDHDEELAQLIGEIAGQA